MWVSDVKETYIIGAGLAGCCLFWRMWAEERRPHLLTHRQELGAVTASMGLMTPLSGPRLAPIWEHAEAIPYAQGFYKKIEKLTQTAFFQASNVTRYLKEHQYPFAIKRASSELTRSWITIDHEHRCTLTGCGFLNVSSFVRATRQFAQQQGLLAEQAEHELLNLTWMDPKIHIFDCRGYMAEADPLWHGIRFRSAYGENAIYQVSNHRLDQPTQKDGWSIIPITPDAVWVGSTYTWDHKPGTQVSPTYHRLDDAAEILQADGLLTLKAKSPEQCRLQVTQGTRPVIQGRLPVFGPHPAYPYIWLLNGLGSKGAAWAPWVANTVVKSLLGVLDLDVSRTPAANWHQMAPTSMG